MNGYTKKDQKVINVTSISSALGGVAGLGYAFYKNKKFWPYVGFFFLGSMVFGGLGYVAASLIIKDKEK